MKHNWPVWLAIRAYVFQFEPLRQVEIHLISAALPPATDCVVHFEIYFWTVNCAATFVHFVIDASSIEAFAEHLDRPIPDFIASNGLFRFRSKICLDFAKTERMPHVICQ